MSYWYVAHPDELLIDLDDYARPTKTGCPYGEAFFRRRLRNAINSAKLPVCCVWLIRSSTKGHLHAIVGLKHELPEVERLVWQLHLGSDLYRGRADLMRSARGFVAPSLIILPAMIPHFYRGPDYECPCKEKHVTEQMMQLPTWDRCDTWNKLRGASPWELFGVSKKQNEKIVNLPVGRVPLELILREELQNP